MTDTLETYVVEAEIDPTGAGQRFLEAIHLEIDQTPIHEIRNRFIMSNQQDSIAGIFLGYLSRNDSDEDADQHLEKSALAEALSC